MPTYTQTVRFEKEFCIQAKNAAEANQKLQDLVDQVEFDADVRSDGWHIFEDDPIDCPKCGGLGVVGEDEVRCDRCSGDGSIPFPGES